MLTGQNREGEAGRRIAGGWQPTLSSPHPGHRHEDAMNDTSITAEAIRAIVREELERADDGAGG